ncbi:hypothetical protein JW859_12470 [bacterium]|nr:hypothetical protein [bacterium]
MRFCLFALLLLSWLIASCDLLFSSQEHIDRTLWPLQSAIEAELGLAVDAETDGHGDTPAGLVDHSSEPTVPPPAAQPTPETAAEPGNAPESAPEDSAPAVEETAESTVLPQTAPNSVAVVSVVDTTSIPTGEEEPDPELLATALRRERVVRQAINNALVENKLINVVQPDEANTELARAEIIAKNSAALSTPLAAEIGQGIGAAVIVCALIDKQGAEVNIVAQLTVNGKLIYQDTIKDWEIVTAEEATTEE